MTSREERFDRREFIVGENGRINKERYIAWVRKVLKNKKLRNKALREIKWMVEKERMDPRYCNGDFENLDIATTKGIIYAIVHLPSKLVYIGQTKNRAIDRLLSHWNARKIKRRDKKERRLAMLLNRTSRIDDFIIWPLQRVDSRLYMDGNRCNHKRFRRYASVIEQHWINRLKTLTPRGLNTCNALRQVTRKQRRKNRPERRDRFLQRTANGGIPSRDEIEEEEILYVDSRNRTRVKVGTRQQHLENKKSRVRIDLLLIKLQRGLAISEYIDSLSEYNKTRTRNFCLKIRMTDGHNDYIEQIIDELNKSMKHKKHEVEEFNDFIKMVQSHPTLRNVRIGKLINSRKYRYLLPKDIGHINVCIKMLSPVRTFMCNHSKVAREVFTTDHNLVSGDQCECRKWFPGFQWEDAKHFVNGHVCTTDLSMIKLERIRYLGSRGLKFREEVTEETLKKAFEEAVNEFIQKIRNDHERKGQPVNEDNLSKWQRGVIQDFNRRYEQQETRLPLNLSTGKEMRELGRLHESFVISPCDKLSHNFGITCKHLYLHKLKQELLENNTYTRIHMESES
jgi:hypothetical protein